jgi:hypothetical protein
VVTCDRCRREIDGPMSTLIVNGTLAATIERVDVCEPCGARLLEWLRAAHTPRGEALAPQADGSHDPARRRPGEAHRPSLGVASTPEQNPGISDE